MKYNLPNEQGEVLPNLLGLSTEIDIAEAEFEGFLAADVLFSAKLSKKSRFNNRYIQQLHKAALGHLYGFAGKWRDVNMSKGGFVFPSALYLPQTMDVFERELLLPLPNKYAQREKVIHDIAVIHGELLFIHPFREGNGRTARLFSNLMLRKYGYKTLDFELLTTDERFNEYVHAVQRCAEQDYEAMITLLTTIF